MKNIRSLLLVCAFLFLTNTFYAQSEYFQKDESGFGLIYSFDKNNIISGNSLGVGFSLRGTFDFDFGYSFGSVKGNNPDGSNEAGILNYTAVEPSTSVYFLKPDSSHKSGVCFTIAYEYTTYTYDSGKYYFPGDKTSSATLFALTFYGEKKNEQVNFLPSFTAGTLFTNGGVNLVIGTGLGIKFKTSDKIGMFISPSVSFYPFSAPSEYKAKYSLNLAAGLLFSTN